MSLSVKSHAQFKLRPSHLIYEGWGDKWGTPSPVKWVLEESMGKVHNSVKKGVIKKCRFTLKVTPSPPLIFILSKLPDHQHKNSATTKITSLPFLHLAVLKFTAIEMYLRLVGIAMQVWFGLVYPCSCWAGWRVAAYKIVFTVCRLWYGVNPELPKPFVADFI